MLWTNVKIVLVVLGTVFAYTVVANIIPQVESDVPREIAFSADMEAEDLIAIGEELYRGAGACMACHDLGTRAPPLLVDYQGTGPIGQRCERRVPGMSCREYIEESLLEPNAYIVEGYPGIMPDARRTLALPQILAIIAYLESQGGEVTVTADEVVAAQVPPANGVPAAAPPAPGAAPVAAADPGADAGELLRSQCLICHTMAGEGNALGPTFDGIGARRSADFLRRKIIDPASEPPAEGYEAFAGMMPPTFGQQFTGAQLEAIVRYLAELR